MAFQDAWNSISGQSQEAPVLLLGNGFSMAYDPAVFAYKQLFAAVDWGKSQQLRDVFTRLNTWDFEYVISALQSAVAVATAYGNDQLACALRKDSDFLKQSLIQAITNTHPEHVFRVDSGRMQRTANFIERFSAVFTLNYDLLLYWTLVKCGLERRYRDGFSYSDDQQLVWKGYPQQEVLYLHGALHLFQSRYDLEKLRYQRSGSAQTLISQIVNRIDAGRIPLFVCEGTNNQKWAQIQQNKYLRYCYSKLTNLSRPLFVYGASLGDADAHIIDAIRQSRVQKVFVSVFGDSASDSNRKLIEAVTRIANDRAWSGFQARFYKAQSVEIW